MFQFLQPILIQSRNATQDICSSIPAESSEDAEWSLFGMSLCISNEAGIAMCQGVDVI